MLRHSKRMTDPEMKKPHRGRLPAALQVVASATIAAAFLFGSTGTTFATSIATNKAAFTIGEHVTITGQGWQPQEMITLILSNSSGTRSSLLQLFAGPDGTFRDDSYAVQELDRDQFVTLTARGPSGAETMVAFRAGIAPGSLKCLATPSSSTNYGISSGKTVTCTIEGASDLSSDQQAGLQPVEVLVKCGTLGNQRATVTSVSGDTVAFTWTPPSKACGATTVSYGPIKVCDRTWGNCATLPAEGNDANNLGILSLTNNLAASSTSSDGIGSLAAGFTILDGAGDPTTCTEIPQLKVETSPKNGSFTAESQASYTIVVSNTAADGGGKVSNVQLADQLPGNGGLVWESASASQGTCSTIVDNTLNCDIGDIAPQGAVTVTVKTGANTPPAACQFQPNPAAIASADAGASGRDSGSLSCTPLAPGQLKVAVAPQNATFSPGGQLYYKIYVSNPAPIGSAPARNVQLKDQLPGNGGLKWDSVSTSFGKCSVDNNNLLTCSFGDIVAQRAATVVVKSTAVTALEACQDQANTNVAVSADGGLTAQASGFVTCTTGNPPQLTLVAGPRNGTFTAGSQLTMTTVVSNVAPAGSASARNVLLTDQLPGNGGLTWSSVNVTPQGSCTLMSNSLNCALGSIAPGASATVVVSTPGSTPGPACTWQPRHTAKATADGGYSAEDDSYFACVQQTCVPSSPTAIENVSWNKFEVPTESTASAVVWVNAHLNSVSNIPAGPTTLEFTDGTLTLDNGSGVRTFSLPAGHVIFDSRASNDTTPTFAGNGWTTVVNPKNLSSEIFFTGAAIPAQSVASGAKATISFKVKTISPNANSDVPVTFSWQWSAAAYTYWPGETAARIQALHDSLHAGAPTNPAVQKSLIQGPRGGAGSNFTGSWSSTGKGTSSECNDLPHTPD